MASKGSNRPLAAIYAQALYEAAEGANALEQVTAEVVAVGEALKKDLHFAVFFETPTIPFDQKRKVLETALKGHSAITLNLLLVLIQRGRSSNFGEIVEAFTTFSEKKAGIASVEVTTATALGDGERAKLVKILENKLSKKIKLVERINPELIGGMVVVHEDKMWDGSLRSKLNEAIHRMEDVKATAVKWA